MLTGIRNNGGNTGARPNRKGECPKACETRKQSLRGAAIVSTGAMPQRGNPGNRIGKDTQGGDSGWDARDSQGRPGSLFEARHGARAPPYRLRAPV